MIKHLLIPCLTALTMSAFCADPDIVNTTDFSISVKSQESEVVGVSNTGTFSISDTTKLQQTVQLTPLQLEQLNSDTEIRVNTHYGQNISFTFSEDPNYVPGATSVSIKQTGTQGPISAANTISASWGNGQFTLKFSGKAQGKGSFTIEDLKPKFSPETHNSDLQFRKGSTTIIEAPVEYYASATFTESFGVDLNGTETRAESISVKSAQLVINDLPTK